MAHTRDQQDDLFGLWVAERMPYTPGRHLPGWCGEPHRAEVARGPDGCLAVHQQHQFPTPGVSWAAYTASFYATALSPWRWFTALLVLHERHGSCKLPNCRTLECFLRFPFTRCSLQVQMFSDWAWSNTAFYKVFHPLWAGLWKKVYKYNKW